jgi:hypothetical protein
MKQLITITDESGEKIFTDQNAYNKNVDSFDEINGNFKLISSLVDQLELNLTSSSHLNQDINELRQRLKRLEDLIRYCKTNPHLKLAEYLVLKRLNSFNDLFSLNKTLIFSNEITTNLSPLLYSTKYEDFYKYENEFLKNVNLTRYKLIIENETSQCTQSENGSMIRVFQFEKNLKRNTKPSCIQQLTAMNGSDDTKKENTNKITKKNRKLTLF